MAGSIPSSFAGDDEASMLTEINVTPLVDVVLVLLIVFMITVPAIVGLAPIKANLPETGSVEVTAERLDILLTLHREDSGEVVLYLGENPIDEQRLTALLESPDVQPIGEQPVSVAADQGIPYGEVIRLLDLLASHGATKISLDTKHVAGS